jgi:hypothetical protein
MTEQPNRSFPATPVLGPATLVCKRNNPNLIGLDLINDAVGKALQEKAARCSAPDWPKARVIAQEAKRALKFSDECQTELCISFTSVKKGSVD